MIHRDLGPASVFIAANRAVELNRRRVEVETPDGVAWNDFAGGLARAGRFEEADKAFARALEIDSGNVLVLVNWSIALVLARAMDLPVDGPPVPATARP